MANKTNVTCNKM